MMKRYPGLPIFAASLAVPLFVSLAHCGGDDGSGDGGVVAGPAALLRIAVTPNPLDARANPAAEAKISIAGSDASGAPLPDGNLFVTTSLGSFKPGGAEEATATVQLVGGGADLPIYAGRFPGTATIIARGYGVTARLDTFVILVTPPKLSIPASGGVVQVPGGEGAEGAGDGGTAPEGVEGTVLPEGAEGTPPEGIEGTPEGTEGTPTEGTEGVPAGPCNPVVFKDAALEAIIRKITGVSSGPIGSADVGKVQGIPNDVGDGQGVTDLTGLECFTDLTEVAMSNNAIDNLSALSGLTKLTRISMNKNQIASVGPLAALGGLDRLELAENQISDLSPLGSLANITYLNLTKNAEISDITALKNMTKLAQLFIEDAKISSLTPLALIPGFTEIWLRNNAINDVQPLVNNAGIGQGDRVYLSGNPIDCDVMALFVDEIQARGACVEFDCEPETKCPQP